MPLEKTIQLVFQKGYYCFNVEMNWREESSFIPDLSISRAYHTTYSENSVTLKLYIFKEASYLIYFRPVDRLRVTEFSE